MHDTAAATTTPRRRQRLQALALDLAAFAVAELAAAVVAIVWLLARTDAGRLDIGDGDAAVALATVSAVVRPLQGVIRRPEGYEFEVICAGAPTLTPTELLGSDHFERLLAECVQSYDVVVIDSPILLAVSDALVLAPRAQCTLIVTTPGGTRQRAFREMRISLARAQARVVGLVLNQARGREPLAYGSGMSDREKPHWWRRGRPRSA